MSDSVQPPEGLPAGHDLRIYRSEKRARGWCLKWRCAARRCDTRGDLTMPTAEAGMRLFNLLAERHRELEPDGPPVAAPEGLPASTGEVASPAGVEINSTET